MTRQKRKHHLLAVYKNRDMRRLPSWRYDRVRAILDKWGRGNRIYPVAGRDDEYVAEAYYFIREWEKIDRNNPDPDVATEVRIDRLFGRNPGLFYAFEAFIDETEDKLRWVIEARILARQSDEEIAEIVGVIPQMVRWYEALFFNVRDRLNNRDYISQYVIGTTVARGLHNITHDLTCKFFAYFAGADVLNVVLDGYNHGMAAPARGGDFNAYFDAHFATQMRRTSASGINPYEMNKFAAERMFEAHLRLIELAKKAEESDTVKTPMEEIVGAVLTNIPWAVGSAKKKLLESSPLLPYVDQAAEPRAADLLLIGRGEAPYSAEQLAAKKLPTPAEHKRDKKANKSGPELT